MSAVKDTFEHINDNVVIAESSGGEVEGHTLSRASSVFSGLALSAWDASMMGMGINLMVKFL